MLIINGSRSDVTVINNSVISKNLLIKQMGLAQNLVKIILVNNVTILISKLKLKY